jgi:hypothetical protein
MVRTTVADSAQRRWNAGTKQGWRVSLEPSQPSWYVVLRNTADLKRAKTVLPSVLRDVPVWANPIAWAHNYAMIRDFMSGAGGI